MFYYFNTLNVHLKHLELSGNKNNTFQNPK